VSPLQPARSVLLGPSSLLASVETRAYRAAITVGQEGREMGQFRQPGGVVVDQTDRIYVADTYNHRVQVFAPDGRFLQAFGIEGRSVGLCCVQKVWPGAESPAVCRGYRQSSHSGF